MSKDQMEELFYYIHSTFEVTLLGTEMAEIENIINPKIFPYIESDDPAPRKLTEQPNNISNEISEEEIEELAIKCFIPKKNKSGEDYTQLIGQNAAGWKKHLMSFKKGYKAALSNISIEPSKTIDEDELVRIMRKRICDYNDESGEYFRGDSVIDIATRYSNTKLEELEKHIEDNEGGNNALLDYFIGYQDCANKILTKIKSLKN